MWPVFRPLEKKFIVKKTLSEGRFLEAMRGGKIDLAIVYGSPRDFAGVIQKARSQGSKVPVIFIWTGSKAPPSIKGVQITQAPALPTIVLEMVQMELGS